MKGSTIDTVGRLGYLKQLAEKVRTPAKLTEPLPQIKPSKVEVYALGECGGCKKKVADVYPFLIGRTVEEAQPVELCLPCSDKQFKKAEKGNGVIKPVKSGRMDLVI